MAPGSRSIEGVNIQGLQRVWIPLGDGDLFQILGSGDLSGGGLLAGGSQKPVKGTVGVVEVNKDSQQGGGGAAGV